jgi:hypothetical protein
MEPGRSRNRPERGRCQRRRPAALRPGPPAQPAQSSRPPDHQHLIPSGLAHRPGSRPVRRLGYQLCLPDIQGGPEHAHHRPGQRTRRPSPLLGRAPRNPDHRNGPRRRRNLPPAGRRAAHPPAGLSRHHLAPLLLPHRPRPHLVSTDPAGSHSARPASTHPSRQRINGDSGH